MRPATDAARNARADERAGEPRPRVGDLERHLEPGKQIELGQTLDHADTFRHEDASLKSRVESLERVIDGARADELFRRGSKPRGSTRGWTPS